MIIGTGVDQGLSDHPMVESVWRVAQSFWTNMSRVSGASMTTHATEPRG
jgi:hypothetical protein